MRIVFDQWKYIFRNLWFVLPFAVTPALFLALSVDFAGVEALARSFFTASLELGFGDIFRAWSLFRYGSALGIVYSVLGVVSLVIFTALLLAFVEKHMRIGKRTLSGILSQLGDQLFAAVVIVLFFILFYELWALVLSAVLFAVAEIVAKSFACVLFAFVSVVFIFVLLYVVSVFYLWLPCRQLTGFSLYNAFLYSYRLVLGVRWRLLLSFLISYVPCFFILTGISFAPDWLASIVAFVLFVFAYLSFCVRMETVYFETDKLEREDILRGYREL